MPRVTLPCLQRFQPNQRVMVIDRSHPLYRWHGRTMRVCIGGLRPWSQHPDGSVWNIPEAWVKTDMPLPRHLRKFVDDRRNYIKLRADQCAAAE